MSVSLFLKEISLILQYIELEKLVTFMEVRRTLLPWNLGFTLLYDTYPLPVCDTLPTPLVKWITSLAFCYYTHNSFPGIRTKQPAQYSFRNPYKKINQLSTHIQTNVLKQWVEKFLVRKNTLCFYFWLMAYSCRR